MVMKVMKKATKKASKATKKDPKATKMVMKATKKGTKIKTVSRAKLQEIMSKKPAAAKPQKAQKAKTVEEMHKQAEALMNKAWSEMTLEEQKEVLAKMSSPPRTIFNKFHQSMSGKNVPEYIKSEYDAVMGMRSKKGADTGKVRKLTTMCKQFYLNNVKLEDGKIRQKVI